jgi:calcium-independent phospholipase A2-gamma
VYSSVKIIARENIGNRTRVLVQALTTTDTNLCITRVEELTFHLLEFPESHTQDWLLWKKILHIHHEVRMRQIKDENLQAAF